VDGSLVPGAAAATNPSVLISALAQRCMDKVVGRIKKDLKDDKAGDKDKDKKHD
jgi:hypothetical protein